MAFDLRRVFRSKTSGEFFLLGQEGILVCPYTFDQTVDSDEWVIVHNNNTTNIIAQVYINDELVKPNEIVIASPNAIVIRFSTPVSGYVNLIAYRIGASECGIIGNVTPTPTVSITPSSTPVASVTPTNSVTPTPTPTFVPSPTASPTATPSLTVTPTLTPTQGATVTPAVTPTLSGTPVVTPTNTVTPTVTPTVTTTTTPQVTPPASITPTPTISVTPTVTTTTTPQATPPASITPTPTISVTPTPSAIVASEAFTSGGDGAPGSGSSRRVDKFSFAAALPISASTVSTFPLASGDEISQHAGQSALVPGTGYVSGNNGFGARISSFPFSSPFVTINDIGFLSLPTGGRERLAGQSSNSDGYNSGGSRGPSVPAPTILTSVVDRFPFSSPFGNATAVGNLNQARAYLTGQQSSTDGYTSGGFIPSPLNIIESFPFASPFVTATDIGDLTTGVIDATGNSSSTDGFSVGGLNPSTPSPITFDTVERFPFSSPFTTSTTIGSLSVEIREAAGQSSTTDGYASGGRDNSPSAATQRNRIDSYPFSNPFAPSTDVGDITIARTRSAGHQG